jgi:hypothetical protein
MPFFARAHYTSEASAFIDSLKASHPKLEAAQRAGRELLWDKAIDLTVAQDIQAGRVAQKPYVYQTAPDEH